jgi:hypothetical protein
MLGRVPARSVDLPNGVAAEQHALAPMIAPAQLPNDFLIILPSLARARPRLAGRGRAGLRDDADRGLGRSLHQERDDLTAPDRAGPRCTTPGSRQSL